MRFGQEFLQNLLRKMINWIIIFLADIGDKVNKIKKRNERKGIDRAYDTLSEERSYHERNAPSGASSGELVGNFAHNTKNVIRDAYDQSFGMFHALAQDRKTKKYIKKNPGTDKPILYLESGLFQNRGGQWRLGKEGGKAGFLSKHLKGRHHLSRQEAAHMNFEDIKKFHEYTGLKNVVKRKDYASGHSSGADRLLYMAGDKRIKKTGIKYIQARAPAPAGIKAKNAFQKAILPFAKSDDVRKYEGKKAAVEMGYRKPQKGLNIHVVSGKYDAGIPPKSATYPHADQHYVMTHKDSSHFGTSGGEKETNKGLVKLLQVSGKSKRKQKGKQPLEFQQIDYQNVDEAKAA